MNERIAVAIDFSAASEGALTEAIAIARRIGADVHMIHVCKECDDDDAEAAKVAQAFRAEAHVRLGELHARYDGQGPALYQSLIDGDPAEALGPAASELGCQTIVLATHGRRGFSRFFLGSVAEKVARTAPIDVLVSRGTRPKRGYQRILVPTDFSAPANRALQRAVEIAAPSAHIDLFHVWQFPGPITMQYAAASSHEAAVRRIADRIRAEASEQAAPLLEAYSSKDVTIAFTAFNGSEGPAIIERAVGCDLIVVGTHGRHGFKRFALGSIVERTIRRAPCSVLTTHAKGDE